ncbi:hypothetical protein Barb7_02713 [Bacteroidales bacterium Barb7]|nr:hypothetical protein Barb7_02713 [Bacteroidales bacterium Barb7]
MALFAYGCRVESSGIQHPLIGIVVGCTLFFSAKLCPVPTFHCHTGYGGKAVVAKFLCAADGVFPYPVQVLGLFFIHAVVVFLFVCIQIETWSKLVAYTVQIVYS